MPINRIIPGTDIRVSETGARNVIIPGANIRLAETIPSPILSNPIAANITDVAVQLQTTVTF